MRIQELEDDDRPIFTSIGLFIIDEIEYANSTKAKVTDVIGGAGTYAGLGARLFLPAPTQSHKSCWIVDMGHDFPGEVKQELDSWDAGIVFRDTPDRKTTRAWNQYGHGEVRDFQYLTPKKRIEVDDLLSNPRLLQSRSFHLICSPDRCRDITAKLARALGGLSDTLIVWEPVPPECKPDNMDSCIEALKDVDLLSPNAKEAAAFWGLDEPASKPEVEVVGNKFLPHLKPSAVLVVRCGAMGCVVMTPSVTRWFPAYFQDQQSVHDPTGGGNSFLGGFTAGYVATNGDLTTAAVNGHVASSFMIEQVGMPKLTRLDDGTELWNNQRAADRVGTYCVFNDIFDYIHD